MKIDFNNIPQAFLESLPSVSSEKIDEIAKAVIPLIALSSRLAPITNVVVGVSQIAYQIYSLDPKEGYTQVAATASNVVLPLLFPRVGMIPGYSYKSYLTLEECSKAIEENDYDRALSSLISSLSTMVYIGSMIFLTPEWLFLSLLLQTLHQLMEMRGHCRSGKYLRAASDLVLACVKSYGLYFQGQTLFRNHCGEKIKNLAEFKALLKEAEKRDDKSIDTLLSEKNISSYIENLEDAAQLVELDSFDYQEENGSYYVEQFNEIDFSNLLIRNCRFSFCNFSACSYTNARFENSGFYSTVFERCAFKNAQVLNSDFRLTRLQDCSLQDVKFSSCDFSETFIEHSQLIRTIFEKVDFSGMIFDSHLKNTQFLDVDFSKSTISHTHLEKTLFKRGEYYQSNFHSNEGRDNWFEEVDLSNSFILEESIFNYFKTVLPNHENPKIIFAFDSSGVGYYTSLEVNVLADTGSNVISARYLPPGVDKDALKREMDEVYSQSNHAEKPIAQTIIERAKDYPNIKRVIDYADDLVLKGDGVLLPGGLDVNPSLYGENYRYDHYKYDRDLFEIALIDAADRYQKPVLGICRGSQIGNVYYGGTLTDLEDGHFGRESDLRVSSNIPKETRKKLIDILGESFSFIALHGQASVKIGEGLYVASEDEGVPKLIVSEDLRTIFSQVHPEVAYATVNYYGEYIEEILRKYPDHYIAEMYENAKENASKAERLFKFFREQALAYRVTGDSELIA